MHIHPQQTEEHNTQPAAWERGKKVTGGKATAQLVNNRPDAIAHRKLQKMVDQSSRVQQAAQLQAKADSRSATPAPILQKKKNYSGLPDNLKAGLENLSGFAMDDVKVHRNSAKPAQLQAHAFAQGTDIHLGPGQEKHLPHEAWHVVQQKQGRVKPTRQLKHKVNLNDDSNLEREADVMGAKALQMKVQTTGVPNRSAINGEEVVQGYFMNGMVKGAAADMREKFLAVKANVDYLRHKEGEFTTFNEDNTDHGQLLDWLVGTARPNQKNWVRREARTAGIKSSRFSEALEAVGTHLGAPRLLVPRLDLEAIKTAELDAEDRGGAPVSPRHRSRIIQIPNLIAMMTANFATNDLLKNFDFILGGGSALTLKKQRGGRLGRPSENMRDIDMDFQVKTGGVRTAIYLQESAKGTPALLAMVMAEIQKEIAKLPGGTGPLHTGNPNLTMGSTIMFNAGDLEYSFHYVDRLTETPLGFDRVDAPGGGALSVINDASHWAMTKSALTARLARPDKIHKTLIDALVLAGTTASRVADIVWIITNKAMHIGGVRYTLKQLYLQRGGGAPAPGLISGLEQATAESSRDHLHSIKDTFMTNRRLSDAEITSARSKYLGTMNAILRDIIAKATPLGRDEVKTNAESVIKGISDFRKWIRGYEHYVNIPDS